MWHTIRVAYFQADKKNLLVNAIKPFVDYVKAEYGINELILKRHWKKGPHIDISLVCDRQLFEKFILPDGQRLISAWIKNNPSQLIIDADQYSILSENLGRMEFEEGPYLPLYEDNAVFEGSYDDKAHLYQDSRIVRAKELFNSKCLDLIFNVISIPKENSVDKVRLLTQMMAVIANGYLGQGMLYGHLSFRSHSEFYFSETKNGEDIKVNFKNIENQIYQEIDDGLRNVLKLDDSQNSAEAQNIADFKIIIEWKKCCEEYRAELLSIINEEPEKYLTYDKFEELSKKYNVYRFEDNKPVNDFGKVFSEKLGEKIFNKPDFQAHRLIINTFYTFLPLLDISPKQKFMLCYFVSNSIERIFHTNWKELIKAAG